MTEPSSAIVRSAIMPDGSYGAEVSIGDDIAWSLSPGAALRYAGGILAVCAAAEHEVALLRLLRSRDMPDELIAQVFHDFREAKPEHHKGTRPLRFTPGVGIMSGEAFLLVEADRVEEPWQWTVPDARGHALHVMQVVAVAELDQLLYDTLTGVGVPTGGVRELITSMGEHWPEEQA